MYGPSRFNLLVVALITFVSFVTARTVITSQTCVTRYCGYPVPHNKIFRCTTSIQKTARYTISKTTSKYTSTRTTKTTKTITSRKTSTTSKVSTATSISTIYSGISTHTRQLTTTIFIASTTLTIPVSTSTISASTKVIPTPSGFVGVGEDPDNKAALFGRPDWKRDISILDFELGRRSAEPEPAPEPEPEPVPLANGKYVTAITCTKILLTKTGVITHWKTITKSGITTKTAVVATKTTTLPITTVTKVSTKTITTKTTIPKVAFATSWASTTRYTTSTKYLSTSTLKLPVQTFYASCGSRNKSPQVNMRTNYAVYNAGPDSGENVHVIMSNGTDYDCCVSCHTYKAGGVCIGSVWRSQIWEGDPGCALSNDPDCVDIPPNPKFRSKCELIIAPSNAASHCRRHTYAFYTTGTEPFSTVSNGLGCRRYKYTGVDS
ncbi:hypothetical protein TWF718_010230 [Orbilia javanica]|uniref:Uncharacterized protein n=1 Tax=Orbilia javanica TaxID=47235 RepID=A0AAN8RAW9_9PEZI